ncbi:MAG TPA: hypothetical protein VFZ28_00050 [Burkholderiaceae bacterium]|nr:hypothetical protein [Burkholderiaceae bacterium]
MFAAIASLACGPSVGAETFHSLAAPPIGALQATRSLSTSGTLRIADRNPMTAWPSSALRAQLLAWPDSGSRASGKFNFDLASDDDRAGSSASISLGRLNLNESRAGPQLGAPSQADLDRELTQLRESISRVRLVPPVSLGMRVRF